LPFEQAIEVISDKGKRVKQNAYLQRGMLPVIDQGQEFIGGYTDDEDMVFEGDLPVILFGDHTRSIKYVDRTFVVGAEGVKILKPSGGLIPKYLYYLLRSLHIPSRGYSRHFQFLRKFHFPRAPEDQQKRIVAEIEKQFSRLDEAVTNLKRVKANLKRYKAAILKAAVEGRLVETEASIARREGRSYETGEQLLQNILETRRSQWKGKGKYKEPAAPDTTDLPELPEGWVWSSVKAISTKVVDGVHKKPNYVPEGIPFVTVKNLTAGPGLSFAELSYVTQEDHIEFCKRTNPERGDILISKDGTLGVVRSINTDVAFSIFVSVALVKPVLKEMQRYLVITFESPVVQRQMVPKGSGLQHIHLEDLRADCIPLPPLPEQRRIVTEVERRFSLVSEVCAQIDVNLMRSGRLSQSILTSAFSARLLGEAMARSHHEALVLRSG